MPDRFKEYLENVDIVIQDWPSRKQQQQAGITDRCDLFGLYEGIPLTERTAHYGMVLPDKITIFRGPLLSLSLTNKLLEEEIEETVRHELAHYFGIDDDRLEELEEGNR